MAGLASRFQKGDVINVYDDVTGALLAHGTALQSRGRTGWADFQVLTGPDTGDQWAYTFNLNQVTVKVRE